MAITSELRNPDKTLIGEIKNAIANHIRQEAEEPFSRIKENFLTELEEIKERTIAQAIIRISEQMTYHDMGHTLKIEVTKLSPTPQKEEHER